MRKRLLYRNALMGIKRQHFIEQIERCVAKRRVEMVMMASEGNRKVSVLKYVQLIKINAGLTFRIGAFVEARPGDSRFLRQ